MCTCTYALEKTTITLIESLSVLVTADGNFFFRYILTFFVLERVLAFAADLG